MKKRKVPLIRVLYSSIFCLIIFWGCATKETVKSLSDEEVLRERVTAYWNHKINEEFEKSYEYESPLYRKQVNRTRYTDSFDTGSKVRWVGMGIDTIIIDGDTAKVNSKVRVAIDSSNPSRKIEPEILLSEQWVKVEGVWYHIPQKVK